MRDLFMEIIWHAHIHACLWGFLLFDAASSKKGEKDFFLC
mgnify:CR=1 FL=1